MTTRRPRLSFATAKKKTTALPAAFAPAFGAAGSAGMQIDTGDAQSVATAFISNEKPDLEWHGARALLPKNQVKLLLNLLLVANSAIPRGGKLRVYLEDLDSAPAFRIAAEGPPSRRSPQEYCLMQGR